MVVLADDNAIGRSDHLLSDFKASDPDLVYIVRSLRARGHSVVPIPMPVCPSDAISAIRGANPDVVMNLTETIWGDRCRSANIAALLELMDVPYTGSGPKAIALSLDKGMSKVILRSAGVRVPDHVVFPPGAARINAGRIKLPAFVKPLHGGGKEGITLACHARDLPSLESAVRKVWDRWDQPAICETYIAGRELTVAVLGNRRFKVFAPREIIFPCAHGPRFATNRVMTDRAYRQKWKIRGTDANLDQRLDRDTRKAVVVACRAIGLRGYGRVDLRLDEQGRIWVVEVNANPALRASARSLIAPWGNVSLGALLDRVLQLAVTNYRLVRLRA